MKKYWIYPKSLDYLVLLLYFHIVREIAIFLFFFFNSSAIKEGEEGRVIKKEIALFSDGEVPTVIKHCH